MTFEVVYDAATGPTDGPEPGAVALRDYILANYPPVTDLGIYNPRRIGGTNRWSTHAEGRALDIGTPATTAKIAGNSLALALRRHHAELGVQYVIWSRQQWTNTRDDEGWRPYNGADPHTGHLHIELTRAAAKALTPTMIADALGGHVPTTTTDRTDQIKQWQRRLAEEGWASAWWLPADQDGLLPSVDPDDDAAIERYADGDFGPATLVDSRDMLSEAMNVTDATVANAGAARKAALFDEIMTTARKAWEAAA